MTEQLWTMAEVLTGGPAAGPLIVLAEPLSFWGGVDPTTGAVIDPHHPQRGTNLSGCALLIGATKGSSSSTSTLLECVRVGTAPAVLLLTEPDSILVVGAAAAQEIYGRGPTAVLLGEVPDPTGIARIRVNAAGQLFGTAAAPTPTRQSVPRIPSDQEEDAQ